MNPRFRWLLPAVVACVHPSGPPGPSDDPAPRLPLGLDAQALARAVPSAFADGLRIHLATDRPLFRPGEAIGVQSWALAGIGLAPRGDAWGPAGIRYDLVDPQGHAVQSLLLPEQDGVARAVLDLPAGAPGGLWTVRAVAVDGTTRERRVVVVPFEAPPVLGDVRFDGDGYQGGDRVTATGDLRRPTGEPLAGSAIEVVLLVDGAEVLREPATTDPAGEIALDLALPVRARDAVVVLLDGEGGSVARPVPIADGPPTVAVFPEGGDLVVGLPSRVYLEATDADGEPVDATGHLVDDLGIPVAAFTARRGRAVVRLVPENGRRYHVAVDGGGAEVALPAARPDGCVLQTRDDPDGSFDALRATVRCTSPRDVVVLATLRGELLDAGRVRADAGGAAVDLRSADPTIAGAQGVAQVTVLARAGEPVAERLVFRNRARELGIRLTTSVAEALPGQRVTVLVKTTDPAGAPVPAVLSVGAVDDAWVAAADEDRIDVRSALLLEPSVGQVDDPAAFLDRSDPDSAEDLDRLLATRGWRTFRRVPTVVADLPAPPPAAPPVVEPEATVRGQVMTKEFLQRVPAGRDYQQAVGVAAGNPNLAGGAWNENVYLLDGENVTQSVGSASSYARFRSQVAIDRDALASLRYGRCVRREEARTPLVGGAVWVSAHIGADGRASDVAVLGTGFRHGGVEACLAEVVRRGRFMTGSARFANVSVELGTATPEVQLPFATVREFPPPPPPRVRGARNDLRPTIAWQTVRTGAAGEAAVALVTSDAVTGFRIVAEGVGGGLAGRAEALIPSRPPLSATVRVPPRLVVGDRVALAVLLENATAEPLAVAVGAEVGDALRAWAPAPAEVEVPARGRVTAWLPIEAVADGTARVRVLAASGDLVDAIDRDVRIEPRGFPHLAGGTTVLGDTVARVALDLRGALRESLEVEVEVAPGAAGAPGGLDSMLGEPHGCFEQTSATSYPNVLVLDWLERERETDDARRRRAEELVGRGLARLQTFETSSGGFEWFGRAPGHVALTAYGLRQFVRTAQVTRVDPNLVRRTAAWLLGRRDGAGGFTPSQGGVDRFGAPDPVLASLYATWALVEAGEARSLGVELAAAARIAERTQDPYALSLATLGLGAAGHEAHETAARRLVALQAPDGSFPGAATTITGSGDPDRTVETTALAATALRDRDPGPAARALGWLAGSRRPDGTWGATQATILAIEALLDAPVAGPGDAVAVAVGERPIGTLAVPRGLASARLPLALPAGLSVVRLDGPAGVPATVRATWRADLPPDDDGAGLALATVLAPGPHAAGEVVRLEVTVQERGGRTQASPVARIGLPAGLSLPAWQVDDLVDEGHAAAVEVTDAGVVLYWDGIEAGGTLTVPLDLVAEVPGTTTGDPSAAWAYYGGGAKTWAAPITAAIGRP